MASPEFAADMEVFDVSNITHVEEILLDPSTASPLARLDLADRMLATPEGP